jgi:nanoRNase/pAp phosphatase (c-di-AMP/oligoRNAs hydrolase)
MTRRNRTARKLRDLRELLAGATSLLIVLQDNPDPDALAAVCALRRLANALAGLHCSFACGDTVGRAENRAMVRYLGLNLRPVRELNLAAFDAVALVDTQPGHGNTSLPAGLVPSVVIDHHPMRPETRGAPFHDVRSRYGATSTILHEYLERASVPVDVPLATALLYGIRSDTQDLGRDATQADVDAYGRLYPLANKRMLGVIQRGRVPGEYFRMLALALDGARLCGRAVYSRLGTVDSADMVGEVADLLLRHEQADWSLCWAYVGDRAFLSLRTASPEQRSDAAIRRIVARKGTGGGHRTMAGGQIALADASAAARRRLDRLIRTRYLKAAGSDPADDAKLLESRSRLNVAG